MPSEKSRRRSGSELPVNQSVPKFRGGVYIWTMNSRRVLSCFVLLAFLRFGPDALDETVALRFGARTLDRRQPERNANHQGWNEPG